MLRRMRLKFLKKWLESDRRRYERRAKEIDAHHRLLQSSNGKSIESFRVARRRYGKSIQRKEVAMEQAVDCIPVPREEYDRVRRALFALMECYGWPDTPTGCFTDFEKDFAPFGFVEYDEGWYWTEAARAFAAEIGGEDG